MNILADFHHSDLFWSLQLLADRLGATLYRPYGMDWYEQFYFKLYGDPKRKDPQKYLAKKYLVDTIYDFDGKTGIGEQTYNGCIDYPRFNLLTLQEAKNTNIDIVICSVNENEPFFYNLREFWPNAKFIRQVGNDLDTKSGYPNLLASAKIPYEKSRGHKVLYRQEFPLNLFRYQAPTVFNNIYSFQNDMEGFEDTWDKWIELKHKLRDFSFKNYGRNSEDGNIYPKRTYVSKMLDANFIFQSKGEWEGYGHTIHNAICLGRPMIIKYSDYKDKLAEALLIKDVTYLEMSDPELINKIRYFSEPTRFKKLSLSCQQVFKDNVDFDEEYELVKEFFDTLI